MVHRGDGSSGSAGHQGAGGECGAIPCSAIRGCQHCRCKVLGKPWRYRGPLLALVTEQSCEGAAYRISWDRTNTSQLSGIDFWQRIQEAAAVLASSSPPPTLLQCVLFWNTQFSYKQSTLSTTCFCTFWNGALRQINESKYGSLPVKILQTVSSQGHWLRQHIILFTVETENPFLPIQ